MDIAIQCYTYTCWYRDFAMSNAKNPFVRVWLQVLPAIQEEHQPGFLWEKMGLNVKKWGCHMICQGKSWKNWASNPGNSWDMKGDLPKKHSGDFCFVGTSTYTQAIAGLITPLLSPASGSCYDMFKLSDIIRHPQRKFMEKLRLLSGMTFCGKSVKIMNTEISQFIDWDDQLELFCFHKYPKLILIIIHIEIQEDDRFFWCPWGARFFQRTPCFFKK